MSSNDCKKKLVIFVWNLNYGGIQKRLVDILEMMALRRLDLQVLVLVKLRTNSHYEKRIQQLSNVTCDYFSSNYSESKSIQVVWWYLKHLVNFKPALVLTYLDHLSILTVIAKHLLFWQPMSIVLNEGVYTSDYLKIYQRDWWWWRKLITWSYSRVQAIVVPTVAVRRDLKDNFGIPNKLIKVIPNWTLLEYKKPSGHKYHLIWIGRLETEKQPSLFVDLVTGLTPYIPSLQVIMIGQGSLNKEINMLITKRKLRCVINQIKATSKINHYLSQSDLLVMTTKNEGMPNIVLEAAAMKIPTISTNYPGVGEVILKNKTGMVVENINQLVSQTRNLLEDHPLRKKLGEKAHQRVTENFGIAQQTRFVQLVLKT